jgi:sugar diacid utilization regulator
MAAVSGRQGVSHLAEMSVDEYLRHSADATARRLAPAWSAGLSNGKLGETLHAFGRASLNVKICARLLDVHTNTIYHRLNSIKQSTGVDPRTYAGLSNLLAIMALSKTSS